MFSIWQICHIANKVSSQIISLYFFEYPHALLPAHGVSNFYPTKNYRINLLNLLKCSISYSVFYPQQIKNLPFYTPAKKLLPSVAKLKASIYQCFRLFAIFHNICFMVCNASISGIFYISFFSNIFGELMFFLWYWQHFFCCHQLF